MCRIVDGWTVVSGRRHVFGGSESSFHVLLEPGVYHGLAGLLDRQLLPGGGRARDNGSRHAVDEHRHGESRKHRQALQTGRWFLRPAAHQLPLALLPAYRPAARGAQQQENSPPVPGRVRMVGGRVHPCGGRLVSLRKISSRLSCPNRARSSSSEPLAMRVPSLMITAWEHSLAT